MSAELPKLRRPTRSERLAFKLRRRWPDSYVDARLAHADAVTVAFDAMTPAEALATFKSLAASRKGALVSPLDGEAMPRPKAAQLARGQKRYRRKVASPKQWQAIHAAKIGPCRVCCDPAHNGSEFGKIQLHHVVSREDHGDDCADNIAPLCPIHHDQVTRRIPAVCHFFLAALTDAEYAYMIERGGENYPERAYGIEYRR